MSKLLLVIDMQNGFVNRHTEHIIPSIKQLIAHFANIDIPIAFTRFINSPTGPHVKWIGWSRLMHEPEIMLIDQLHPIESNVFDKHGYTAFTEAFEAFLYKHAVTEIFLCGVATDSCILKTAVDSFERGIRPIIIQDACASHAGQTVHEAGLLLISRFVGRRQIVTTQSVLDTTEHNLSG